MTDLKALEAELERQNRDFEACLEQLRAMDKDATFNVSTEFLEALEETSRPHVAAAPAQWMLRG